MSDVCAKSRFTFLFRYLFTLHANLDFYLIYRAVADFYSLVDDIAGSATET